MLGTIDMDAGGVQKMPNVLRLLLFLKNLHQLNPLDDISCAHKETSPVLIVLYQQGKISLLLCLEGYNHGD